MVLHALFENAIKHGIGQIKGPGMLLVQASVLEQVLSLAIENTGKLRESTCDGVHHGLSNIRERLILLFGDRAKLHLQGVGDRLKATVAIPMFG